jgi:CheY-like chemotaxis protein
VDVLIVDDDPESREVFATFLTSCIYSFATARDGSEALEHLRSIRPSVIFLDLDRPIINGEDFLRAQRQDPALARIPTIVMTAAEVVPMSDVGIEETVRKPIENETLLRILRRHCVLRRR